jgi:hypothetical protein
MTMIASRKWAAAVALWSLLNAGAAAAEWDVAANVDLQSRLFADPAQWQGQDSSTAQLSLAATAELRWYDRGSDQRASIIPYIRIDSIDDERSLVDLPEAYWASRYISSTSSTRQTSRPMSMAKTNSASR